MRNYIEDYEALLNTNDRRRLEGFLDVGAKAVTANTDAAAEGELETRIQELMAELGQGKMTMQLRLQEVSGQTNSVVYNLNLQEIIADLSTLYSESNRIDALLTNHAQLNKAILGNLQKDIARLKNRIDTLNLLADNVQGYGTASREDFSDQSKVETDRDKFGSLFVDRDGHPIGLDLGCQIDPIEGTLKLGSSSSYDRIHTLSGSTIATIEILDQVGEGFSNADPNYGPGKAIDGRADTFWGEVILSDGILKIPMAASESETITQGALCKFKVTFPTPVAVSQFSFKPYCEYPIEIIYVAYSRTDSNNIEPGCYCVPYNKDNPILTDKGITLDFPLVVAKSLIVVIRQASCTKNHYTVSVEDKNNKELWAKITAAERKTTLETIWCDDDPDTINPALSQDMVDQFDVRWQAYLAAKKAFDADPLNMVNSVLFGYTAPRQERVAVEKYEYVYGAYEIGVKGQEYNPVGIYVSKPHQVNGNVQTVVLEAKEWHPTFVNSTGGTLMKKVYTENGAVILPDPLRKTSVEYYVTPGDSDRWIAIMPLDQTEVNTEFLMFPDKSNPRATTRFPIDMDNAETRVYRDDNPLPPDGWNFVDNQTIKIETAHWDTESYYTIDYAPDENVRPCHVIDFTPGVNIGYPKAVSELFNAPESKVIDKNFSAKLAYYPYVDRSSLAERNPDGTMTMNWSYNPVRVTLNPSDVSAVNPNIHRINGPKAITVPIGACTNGGRNPSTDVVDPKPPARTLNVTDYFNGEIPVLNLYNPTPHPVNNPIPTFEYYHDGKQVVLTETFRHDGPMENYGASNGTAIVRIDYEYLVSGVRCKVVLRRTSRVDASVTPKVDWYAFKFKVLVV